MDRMGKKAVKGIVVLLAAGQVLLTAACGKEAEAMPEGGRVHREETEEREGEEVKITAEYLKEEFGISEEELEGIDLEDFLEYFEITMDNIQDSDLSFCLWAYREMLNGKFTADYSHILEGKSRENLTEENATDMVCFVWKRIYSESADYIVMDFETQRVFAGRETGYVSLLTEEDVTAEADNALKEQLISCFSEYDVYSWWDLPKHERTGEGHGGWNITIIFTDGRACYIEGENPTEADAPETLIPFIDEMWELSGVKEY